MDFNKSDVVNNFSFSMKSELYDYFDGFCPSYFDSINNSMFGSSCLFLSFLLPYLNALNLLVDNSMVKMQLLYMNALKKLVDDAIL